MTSAYYPAGTWTDDEVVNTLKVFGSRDLDVSEAICQAVNAGHVNVPTKYGITTVEYLGSQDGVNLYRMETHARTPVLTADATDEL